VTPDDPWPTLESNPIRSTQTWQGPVLPNESAPGTIPMSDSPYAGMPPSTPPPPTNPFGSGRPPFQTIGGVLLIVAGVILLFVILFHSRLFGKTTAQIAPTPTFTPAPTATLAPTATVVATACTDVSSFAEATPATTGSANFEAPFPTQTISVITTPEAESSSYQYRLVSACTPAMTPDTLLANYNTLLPADGWSAASTQLPPAIQSYCVAGNCWQKNGQIAISGSWTATVSFFVGISGVQAQGSVTTYTLGLVIGPIQLTTPDQALSAGNPTYHLDANAPVDMQWSNGQVQLQDAALAATLPGGACDSTTFQQLQQLHYTGGTLPANTYTQGACIALQSNAGKFAKLTVTSYTSTAISIHAVVYPFSF
jgi:hypothetical protein